MKRFFREYILENWTLKLIALLLAWILWLFVRGEPGPVRVVAVPLEVELPLNMEITSERPTSVEVTLKWAAFSSMWFSQLLPSCVIDLAGADEGKHVVDLTSENLRIPAGSGIEVLQVNPARVTLVLERTVSKEVPIVVPIRGEPLAGFEVYSKSLRPAKTVVTGPRSHIDSVSEVYTEAVTINGQKQPVQFFVNLNLKDNAMRTSLAGPVQVAIQIGPRRSLYTIDRVAVSAEDAAYAVAPRHLAVEVLASPESMRNLTAADIKATVETKALRSSLLPVKVKPLVRISANISGEVTIKDVRPPEVTVRRSAVK